MVMCSFWHGKRVLVTGHTGFKGSWLSLWLHTLGANVAGYALEPEDGPSLFTLARVANAMQSTVADIRDAGRLQAAIDAFRPEIVLHLAAQSLVRASYDEPVLTYETNVMGTVNLLQACRNSDSVRVVVNVTSDKCYENTGAQRGYTEDDPMGGDDPYSSSKGCSELLTTAWRKSFFSGPAAPALASARAGNVIGGGDWARDRLVPDMLQAFAAGRPVRLRHPDAVRPWQHVLEPLSGYLLLAERLWDGPMQLRTGWNFGPAALDARPVHWIAAQLAQAWGDAASWELDKQTHPHEAHHLTLDSAKARTLLGWVPRWPLGKALESIVEWHRAYLAGACMREMTLTQIGRYNENGNP
jgi:CDP-glucose 4,6-dehydratase